MFYKIRVSLKLILIIFSIVLFCIFSQNEVNAFWEESRIKIGYVAPGISDELSHFFNKTEILEELETKTQQKLAKELLNISELRLNTLRKYIYFNLSYVGEGFLRKKRVKGEFVSINIFPLYNEQKKRFIDKKGKYVCLGISERCKKDIEEFYKNIEETTFLPILANINNIDIILYDFIDIATGQSFILEESISEKIGKCLAMRSYLYCKRKLRNFLFTKYPLQILIQAFEKNSGAIYTSIIDVKLKFNVNLLKMKLFKAGENLLEYTVSSSISGSQIQSSKIESTKIQGGW